MLSSTCFLKFLTIVLFLPYLAWNLSSDDYEEEEEEEGEKTPPPELGFCDYDRCRHLQVPCKELQGLNGSACLCPGTSSPSQPPEPPRLGDVRIWPDEGRAEVHWCAPASPVDKYWLDLWEGSDPVRTGPPVLFNNTVRRAELEGLKPGGTYILCVVASNDAGESPVPEGGGADFDANGMPLFGPCRHLSVPLSLRTLLHIAVGIGMVLICISSAVLLWHFCPWKHWGHHQLRGGAAFRAGEEL
ncbi:LRRN4 C-terminal-like protein [Gracilinanus agilis]|uniref:LRRN4 C-terminal-like protein n=1 Tax=Gracilinanus agilis TaxID=191870 RepID=UPI001CFE9C60|nr:LRRN4 C-terminal-like protein [Gracilinanus agilis]